MEICEFGEIFVVRLARFEHAAYGLEVRCSIQLSYRRNNNLQIYQTGYQMSIKKIKKN